MSLFRRSTCAHQWKLLDKTELPPPIEEMRKHGYGNSVPYSAFLRKVHLILCCEKCGKLEDREYEQA